MSSLDILFVAAEVAPFAKTGGLADVSAALPRHLARAGHRVRLVMPLYGRVHAKAEALTPHPDLQDLELELGGRSLRFSVETAPLPGSDLDVWFLRCDELYGGDEIYTEREDEHVRFALLAAAGFRIAQQLGWSPDIVHLNDWHTALAPLFLKSQLAWDRLFEKTKTVLTIHNIGYQGVFPSSVAEEIGFGDQTELFHREDFADGTLNFLKTGVLYADALTTVSRTYAREIQTPEFGAGLEELLRERSESLVGIVNGVDYAEWNPATDAALPVNYDAASLEKKLANKQHLCKRFGLDLPTLTEEAPGPLLFGVVSRLTGQKGFELLPDILPVLLREADARLVVLGSGEERYERYFQWLRDAFPDRVAVFKGYSEELSHQIEAGSDAFLMPSRYEPCGLNQMYSLKYGTVPIVRRTGGLADTVEDYDAVTGEGTGFVFDEFSPEALLHALRRALHVWKDLYAWRRIVRAGMERDFSWTHQGAEYEALYDKLRS